MYCPSISNAILVFLFFINCSTIFIDKCSAENDLDEPTMQENVTVHIRHKRNTITYKCSSNRCQNGVCTPRSYEGPNPPDWCRHLKPHRSESKCEWTKTCWNHNQCRHSSSSCEQVYEDLTPGSQSTTTFNFKCSENYCTVDKCRNGRCYEREHLSMSQLEDIFIKRLPRCEDMDKRYRKKRAPLSTQNLSGYCCDITEKWDGGVIGTVRRPR